MAFTFCVPEVVASVPVITIVEVPGVAELDTTTVKVDVPEPPVTEEVLNVA